MKYSIGLDIGTSAVKGILVDENENIIGSAEAPFIYSSPAPAEVIISSEDYLASCYRVLRTLSEKLPEGGTLVAVCEASASGNLLLLDENNTPITPIYNWQDSRVTTETEQVLGKDLFDKIYGVVGWCATNAFPLALLCWMKVHNPDLLEKAAFVTMSTEYLNFTLCGKWGISPSAGTPFHLIEQETAKYYKPFLDKLGINENQLPPVLPIGTQIGTVTKSASINTGLPEGTPVMLGTFDHISGAIGANVINEGEMLLSCGTSWVTFNPIAKRQTAIDVQLLADPFLSFSGGNWACMSSIPSVAANINEYINRYISDGSDRFALLDEYCLAAEKDAGGLVIDPLISPDDAPSLYDYDKKNIARALMVGVAKEVSKKIDVLSEAKIISDKIVMIGGPSRSKVWQSVIAEFTKKSVTPASGVFTGALGAAKIGFGFINNLNDK